jgi:hypothetical protein
LAAIEAQGLKAVDRADRANLLRRTTFDLIGLLSTLAEIDAFVLDESPEAFAKVVDSPMFRGMLCEISLYETAGWC